MASIVPADIVQKIQFFEDHNAPWSTNAVAIGATVLEITALATKTAAARAAYDAQRAAQLAAKNATLTLRLAVKAMAGAGGNVLKKVRAKAATDGTGVYALASIPAPATPAPVPPPGTPGNFNVSLSQGGALTLLWKCVNPVGASGTIYQVYRRMGAGAFSFIGGTGNKKFVDETLPTGSSSVTYRIVATRSTAQGPEALFTVNFGVGAGSGEMVASIAQDSAPKLAA